MTISTNHLWIYGGPRPAPFPDQGRSNCVGKQDYFFPRTPDEAVDFVPIARQLCATCTAFRSCTRWVLSNPVPRDLDDGIFAGLTPDQRSRIWKGEEPYRDWRRDFNYTQRKAKAAARRRARAGVNKRVQRLGELVPCPSCHQTETVVRDRRDRESNRQSYRCNACKAYYLGEAL